MDGSNVRKLKKAVVSLQKLDLSTQSSKSGQGVPSDSGGSEDTVSENAALDSADSNVGCTDDDDLEKKIQAFSIPVKKDEKPINMNEPDSKPRVKDKDSIISDKCKGVDMLIPPLDTKSSKEKTDNIDLEREKVAHNKTASEKEKLPYGKIAKDKEKTPRGLPGRMSGSKVCLESNKIEELKGSKAKPEIDALFLHKQRKRKCSVDSKSIEDIESQSAQIKRQKAKKPPEISSQSTSKGSNLSGSTKSRSSKKNKHDSFDHTTPVKRTSKHMSYENGKSKERDSKEKEIQRKEKQDSKEKKKRNVNDNKYDKQIKEVVKNESLVSKPTTSERNKKIKVKKSEQMSKNDSVKKQGSSKLHVKKPMKLDKYKPPIKEKHEKNINDLSEKCGSEDLKIQHGANLKNSKNTHVSQDSNKNKNNSLVKKSIVKKDSKRLGSKKILWNSASSASHSLGHSVGVKLKKFNNGAKLIPKKDKKVTNKKKSSVSEEKSDIKRKSRKSAGNTKEETRKTLSKHKRLLQRLEHSVRKLKVKSNYNFENEGIIDLVHDNLPQETLPWDCFFLTNELFKTVSKKSDKLPSQNIGTESYKKLWKWSHCIRMPGSMWSLHKHPNGDYVMILHIAEISSTPKIVIDKCVQFKGNAFPVVKLYDKEIPSLQTTAELRTLGEVCSFLKQIDDISLCGGLKHPLDGTNSNCEMFTSSKVVLPFTCKHCKNFSGRAPGEMPKKIEENI